MTNPIKIVIIKTDSYLDITYYRVKIKYWDGEEILKENLASFTFGDILIPVLKNIDNMNTDVEILIHIENDELIKQKMKYLTNQIESKDSKIKLRKEITSSSSDSKWLKDFIKSNSIMIH